MGNPRFFSCFFCSTVQKHSPMYFDAELTPELYVASFDILLTSEAKLLIRILLTSTLT